MESQAQNLNVDTSIINNSNSSTPSSVRSSSNKGQFSRYKNMFDSLLRTKSREKYKDILNADTNSTLLSMSNSQKNSNELASQTSSSSFLEMPLSDDEKSSHLQQMSSSFSIDDRESTRNSSTLAAVFYGVSDETSSMLNSILSGNEQIAEFFDKPLHCLNSPHPWVN
jgi:hypothetical protein